MAKSGTSINWGGLDRMLERAVGDIANTKQLMSEVGQAMVGQTQRRFKDETGPDGQPWEKNKRGGKTLTDTARLKKSINFSATPFEVHVGSNLAYARVHQLGGQAGRGQSVSLPARPYLGVSDEDAEEIKALVAEYMARALS